jgi:uncharacterized membrane protein
MNRPVGTRFIAFVAVMSAIANALGLLVVPVGFVTLHLIQLPIVFSGLAAGSLAGGLVGFFGAFVMALTLAKPNPYLIPGNAILGLVTGLVYSKIRGLSTKPIFPQIISVLLAYAVQMPYTYVTDVYSMGMPQPVVVGIVSVLLVEDLISALLSHVILYRVDVHALLSQR